MDGDGDVDVLGTAQSDNEISWYENDGSENFTQHIVNGAATGVQKAVPADVDSDGDVDIVSAEFQFDNIMWYENDGAMNFTPRNISNMADQANDVTVADVNGDGFLDVLSASSNDDKLAWYENDGAQNFTERVISTSGDQAWTVKAADMDGDTDIDVVRLSFADNKVSYFENDGSENFTETVVSTSMNGPIGLALLDLNSDGDLDILSTSSSNHKVAYFENQVNNALDFDGADDFVSIADNALLETNPITVEFWFKKNDNTIEDTPGFGDSEGLLYKSPDTSPSIAYAFLLTDTDTGPSSIVPFDLTFAVGDGSQNTLVTAASAIQPGEWYHVAGVLNGNNMELFLNGISVGTNTTPLTPSMNNDPIVLGKASTTSGVERFFNGQMDQLRVWNTARTANDIRSNMHINLVGNEAGLAAYYDFDTGDAGGINTGLTTLTDLTSNALDGTLNTFMLSASTSNWVASGAQHGLPNAPSNLITTEVSGNRIDLDWDDNSFDETDFIIERSDGDNTNFVQIGMSEADAPTFVDASVSSGNGYFYRVKARGDNGDSGYSNEKFGSTITLPGNALDFDGVNDHVIAPHSGLSPSEITVELWMRMQPTETTPQMLVQNGVLGVGIFVNRFNSSGNVLAVFDANSGNNSAADETTISVNDGVWHHIAATNDGSTTRVYIDGVLSATHAEPIVDLVSDMFLGSNGGTIEFFDGEMDELRFWDVARSQSQIQNNMSNTMAGNEPNLAALLSFRSGFTGWKQCGSRGYPSSRQERQ